MIMLLILHVSNIWLNKLDAEMIFAFEPYFQFFLVKYSDMSDKSNEAEKYNGSDSIELASARETIVLTRNESEGFGFVIMSSPR